MLIAGTPETVKTFNHEVTRRFHEENFGSQNLIITAVGNIETIECGEPKGAVLGGALEVAIEEFLSHGFNV